MSDDNDKGPDLKVDRDVRNLSDRVSSLEGFINGAKWIIGISITLVAASGPIIAMIINSMINGILDNHSMIPNDLLEALEEMIKNP